jgi:peptidoglycan/xylan/chitin deacetylase (PgdA/CDA1 family)
MSLIHRLLAAAYPVLRLQNVVSRRFGMKRAGRMRVLTYHDISPHQEQSFAAHLNWLAKSWRFVDPQHFAAMITGDEPVLGNNLLLTFDDGFASNRWVAERVLAPMDIRAIFFVVSSFVQLSRENDQQDFIAQHFFPGINPSAVPAHLRNMNFDDLEYLLEAGHTIGAHTATHCRLSEVEQTAELEAEIIESANLLENRLKVRIDHFAYTYGNLASFSPLALAVARHRFKYIYTGFRGDNSIPFHPWAIRRDAVAVDYSQALLGAFLEGGADQRYVSEIAGWKRELSLSTECGGADVDSNLVIGSKAII